MFCLLVNRKRAVPVHIEQVLADQVLVVDESRAADHLSVLALVVVFVLNFHLCEVVAEVDKGVEADDDGDEVDEEREETAEESEDESVPCTLSTA